MKKVKRMIKTYTVQVCHTGDLCSMLTENIIIQSKEDSTAYEIVREAILHHFSITLDVESALEEFSFSPTCNDALGYMNPVAFSDKIYCPHCVVDINLWETESRDVLDKISKDQILKMFLNEDTISLFLTHKDPNIRLFGKMWLEEKDKNNV